MAEYWRREVRLEGAAFEGGAVLVEGREGWRGEGPRLEALAELEGVVYY